jgi:hypothetical protein
VGVLGFVAAGQKKEIKDGKEAEEVNEGSAHCAWERKKELNTECAEHHTEKRRDASPGKRSSSACYYFD